MVGNRVQRIVSVGGAVVIFILYSSLSTMPALAASPAPSGGASASPAASGGGGGGGAASSTTVAQTVLIDLDKEGQVQSIKTHDAIHVEGDGDTTIQYPVDGIDGVSASGGPASPNYSDGKISYRTNIKNAATVYGDEKLNTSKWKDKLPMSFKIDYFLDGALVKPEEIKGKSGDFKIDITITNNTAAQRHLEYDPPAPVKDITDGIQTVQDGVKQAKDSGVPTTVGTTLPQDVNANHPPVTQDHDVFIPELVKADILFPNNFFNLNVVNGIAVPSPQGTHAMVDVQFPDNTVAPVAEQKISISGSGNNMEMPAMKFYVSPLVEPGKSFGDLVISQISDQIVELSDAASVLHNIEQLFKDIHFYIRDQIKQGLADIDNILNPQLDYALNYTLPTLQAVVSDQRLTFGDTFYASCDPSVGGFGQDRFYDIYGGHVNIPCNPTGKGNGVPPNPPGHPDWSLQATKTLDKNILDQVYLHSGTINVLYNDPRDSSKRISIPCSGTVGYERSFNAADPVPYVNTTNSATACSQGLAQAKATTSTSPTVPVDPSNGTVMDSTGTATWPPPGGLRGLMGAPGDAALSEDPRFCQGLDTFVKTQNTDEITAALHDATILAQLRSIGRPPCSGNDPYTGQSYAQEYPATIGNPSVSNGLTDTNIVTLLLRDNAYGGIKIAAEALKAFNYGSLTNQLQIFDDGKLSSDSSCTVGGGPGGLTGVFAQDVYTGLDAQNCIWLHEYWYWLEGKTAALKHANVDANFNPTGPHTEGGCSFPNEYLYDRLPYSDGHFDSWPGCPASAGGHGPQKWSADKGAANYFAKGTDPAVANGGKTGTEGGDPFCQQHNPCNGGNLYFFFDYRMAEAPPGTVSSTLPGRTLLGKPLYGYPVGVDFWSASVLGLSADDRGLPVPNSLCGPGTGSKESPPPCYTGTFWNALKQLRFDLAGDKQHETQLDFPTRPDNGQKNFNVYGGFDQLRDAMDKLGNADEDVKTKLADAIHNQSKPGQDKLGLILAYGKSQLQRASETDIFTGKPQDADSSVRYVYSVPGMELASAGGAGPGLNLTTLTIALLSVLLASLFANAYLIWSRN